jgi:hypothetical protein
MGKIVNVNGYNNITIEHSSMIKIKKEKWLYVYSCWWKM